MSLIANTRLPTFERLRQEGLEVLAEDRAEHQDIRELHIGILNMMPDAALEATERQFMRMVGACNRIAQFTIHLFSFPEIPRGDKAKAHIEAFYTSFEQLKEEGLDALIISGANPALDDLTEEPFWDPLIEVVKWANDNVCSVMCSCLATHAIVKQLWGIERYHLSQKRWGVYSHRVVDFSHPLVANINTRFDAPHSHVYEVNSRQFRDQGLRVLASGEESDLHIATSPDGWRFVFFQGHPEYDIQSLLKEYKREVGRVVSGERTEYPPFPENYLSRRAAGILNRFRDRVLAAQMNQEANPAEVGVFPEAEILTYLDNTWGDTGKAVVNNWLGLVYQLTDKDRKIPFMKHVDLDNPLGLATDD